MPSGLEQDNTGAGLQAGVSHVRKPLVQTPPDRFTLSFLAVFNRIIDDQEVSAASGDRPAASNREVRSTRGRAEPAHAARVFSEAAARENGLMEWAAHQIADPTSKIVTQFLSIA